MYLNGLMPDIDSLVSLIGKLLTDDSYMQEPTMQPEEQLHLRRVLYEAIIASVSVSFSFDTKILPKPIKVTPLMRRLTEMLEPILPPKHFLDIRIALEEIISNIIEHSYSVAVSGSEEVEISCYFSITSADITITVEDNGERGRDYNFDEVGKFSSLGELKNSIRKTRGGMGVFLVRKIMDEVRYYVEPGQCNRIVMRKIFSQQTPMPEQLEQPTS